MAPISSYVAWLALLPAILGAPVHADREEQSSVADQLDTRDIEALSDSVPFFIPRDSVSVSDSPDDLESDLHDPKHKKPEPHKPEPKPSDPPFLEERSEDAEPDHGDSKPHHPHAPKPEPHKPKPKPEPKHHKPEPKPHKPKPKPGNPGKPGKPPV